MKYLTYEPQDLDSVLCLICSEFSPAPDKQIIQHDAELFYKQLSEYVAIGNTEKECEQNSKKFKYIEKKHNSPLLSENCSNEVLESWTTPVLQQVMIEITKCCNERCIHCYIPHENKNIAISESDFFKIVDECEKIGTVVDFRISGGECMTHPSFKKFIRYIKQKGFALHILTNSLLLDNEIIEILAEGTLSDVQVSLFSLNSKIHDSITTTNGSLEKTLANIEKLHKANILVSIATQIMEINKNCLNELRNYADKNGFALHFDWTIGAKEDCTNQNLDFRVNNLNDYIEICENYIKAHPQFKIDMEKQLNAPLKKENLHCCSAGLNSLQIGPDLSVHPCAGWGITAGNLKESSLIDIWKKFKHFAIN